MDIVAMHAAAQPHRVALVEGGRRLTWSELAAARNRLAHALARRGVAGGAHVAIHALNGIDNVIAGLAVRGVGAVPVLVNHRLVAEEVAYILDDSDAVAVFVGETFLAMAEALRGGAKVRHWLLLEGARRPWAESVDDITAAEPADRLPGDGVSGIGAAIVYTSGTTGRPKGAMRSAVDPALTRANMEALGVADPAQVHLLAGPMYHSAPPAFALYAQLAGGTVVVMRKFDAEEALHLIARERCTTTFMAPTLLKRIVDLPAAVRSRHDVSSMRAVIVAGAPCPMRVKEQVIEYFGPVLYEFYGSTELGINTILRPEDVLRKPGSCGRPGPEIELAIFDGDGRPVPDGEPGELHVRRYRGIFDGYWKRPEAVRETMRGEWYSVGDVAYRDAEGYYYICDRKRDMIISGGVNIYPAEIEDVLHRHPAIADIAVFGVPDEEWGERVHAAVEPRPGHALAPEDVIAFARAHMAHYKAPREVSVHLALPRDHAGKLLKRVLREPYWAGRAARV
ncbi:MAG: AMP-binding protein [Candidatus Rokubacteria bacterium]|nr:AMP-binding protein [Candidatus Rokubacteria bacterium]